MQKTAIVTGASRGIGAATALLLSRNGYRVVINYLKSADRAKTLLSQIKSEGNEASIFKADVSKSEEADALVNFAIDYYGAIDLVVNNAGVSLFSLVTETDDEQYEKVFGVNTKGVFNMCRSAVSFMINRKHGAIVNIGSMWGRVGASCEAVYSASKAAVEGFTKALAKEISPSGITVNCIAPGLIDTEMNSNLTKEDIDAIVEVTPAGKMGTPDDIARLVLFLAREDYITGQIISCDGGLTI